MVWMVPLGRWWRSPQRPFLLARVVGEYGVVWGWEEKLQVVPQARVHVGGHARLVEYPARACVAGPCAASRRIAVTSRTSGEWLWVMR